VRQAQRQPDLVGGASSLSVGAATEEGGGLSPESESGSPECVHGDGLDVGGRSEGVLEVGVSCDEVCKTPASESVSCQDNASRAGTSTFMMMAPKKSEKRQDERNAHPPPLPHPRICLPRDLPG
jgi:hypothetical protein